MAKWKKRVKGSPAQIGQPYKERARVQHDSARRKASGTELAPQNRAVESMKKPVSTHEYKFIKSARQEAFHIGEKHPEIRISEVSRCKTAKEIHELHRRAHKIPGAKVIRTSQVTGGNYAEAMHDVTIEHKGKRYVVPSVHGRTIDYWKGQGKVEKLLQLSGTKEITKRNPGAAERKRKLNG